MGHIQPRLCGHKFNKIKETANTIANMQNVQKTSRLVEFKLDQDLYSKWQVNSITYVSLGCPAVNQIKILKTPWEMSIESVESKSVHWDLIILSHF